jgi:hypothetical protein
MSLVLCNISLAPVKSMSSTTSMVASHLKLPSYIIYRRVGIVLTLILEVFTWCTPTTKMFMQSNNGRIIIQHLLSLLYLPKFAIHDWLDDSFLLHWCLHMSIMVILEDISILFN